MIDNIPHYFAVETLHYQNGISDNQHEDLQILEIRRTFLG